MSRLILLLVLLAACGRGVGHPPEPAPLILVSLDGFRWDYLDRGITPTLAGLARAGVRAHALLPVFPTKTFPNHYTLVTGSRPAGHGIVGNEFYATDLGARFSMHDRASVRDPRFWAAEPIWVTAERQGKRTATLFWPGSEAAIAGVRPTYWLPYDSSLPDTARVRQVLAWLDLPRERRPSFLTLYLGLVDAAGHRFGPEAAETREAVARADTLLGLLLRGLAARGLKEAVNLVVVSDHGMAPAGPDQVIILDDYVAPDAVRVDALSPVLMLRPRAGLEDSVLRGLRAAPHLAVYRRDSLPRRWHLAGSPRVSPIVAVADEGWSIARRSLPGAAAPHPSYGEHGYDDSLSSMGALFVARGPAFRSGLVVPAFRNLHVYPLLAELLGVQPAPAEGALDSVRGMLRPRIHQ
jgi:predicted AlkP superfamily pyrophosphatase or phosphodiesterase